MSASSNDSTTTIPLRPNEIATGVYHFDTGPFNWYLIEQDGRLTLVDAGFPGHYTTFREGLQLIGHDISDIEAIVITHAHADHTGFAARLNNESKAPIYIHADDVIAASKAMVLPWYGLLTNAWRPYVAGMLTHAIGQDLLAMPRIKEPRVMHDGDDLAIPGQPHVIHVPGHTAGEVALYLPDRDLLFSGDTLVTRDLLTGTYSVPQVPSRILNDDFTVAKRSIDRLKELGTVTMLPGHGMPWTGTMAEAISYAQQAHA